MSVTRARLDLCASLLVLPVTQYNDMLRESIFILTQAKTVPPTSTGGTRICRLKVTLTSHEDELMRTRVARQIQRDSMSTEPDIYTPPERHTEEWRFINGFSDGGEWCRTNRSNGSAARLEKITGSSQENSWRVVQSFSTLQIPESYWWPLKSEREFVDTNHEEAVRIFLKSLECGLAKDQLFHIQQQQIVSMQSLYFDVALDRRTVTQLNVLIPTPRDYIVPYFVAHHQS